MEDIAVMDEKNSAPEYAKLVVEKAARLDDLLKQKPGHKNYKRSLNAFLEVDAKVQQILLRQVERASAGPARRIEETRTFGGDGR